MSAMMKRLLFGKNDFLPGRIKRRLLSSCLLFRGLSTDSNSRPAISTCAGRLSRAFECLGVSETTEVYYCRAPMKYSNLLFLMIETGLYVRL